MIRCTGTKGAMCCSSEQSFYHSECSTHCILPSHFHLRWDTVWSMCRLTCSFPESCTLKRECWIEIFSFCTISPFQYLFFLTGKQCLCHSELQIPSNISGMWREACGRAHQGCVAGFWKHHAGNCQALSIFKIQAHSWVLSTEMSGQEFHWKSAPDFAAWEERASAASVVPSWGGRDHARGVKQKVKEDEWGMMALSPAGTSSQPIWDVLPKPRSWGFWSRDTCPTTQVKRTLLQTSEEG